MTGATIFWQSIKKGMIYINGGSLSERQRRVQGWLMQRNWIESLPGPIAGSSSLMERLLYIETLARYAAFGWRLFQGLLRN
jgi:hypothetical protein